MVECPTPQKSYLVGLDLGQTNDFTALAVLERNQVVPAAPPAIGYTPGPVVPRIRQQLVPAPATYAIRHLLRFPLGTSYPAIIAGVGQLLDRPERAGSGQRPLRGCTLVVDRTGVGAPVCDTFVDAHLPATLRPVVITGGSRDSHEGGVFRVAKLNLVSVLRVLLGNSRLIGDKTLPYFKELGSELQTFSVKITAAGNETWEAWREQDHDDLVLAVALACWWGERGMPEPSRCRPLAAGGMGSLKPAADGSDLYYLPGMR